MANIQLHEYILNAEAQGHSEEDIRSFLVKEGYDFNEVNQAFVKLTDHREEIKSDKVKSMPLSVKIISYIFYGTACLKTLVSLLFLLAPLLLLGKVVETIRPHADTSLIFSFLLFLFFAGLAILDYFVAHNLHKAKKWARYTAIALSIFAIFDSSLELGLLLVALKNLFFLGIIYYLIFDQETKEFFN